MILIAPNISPCYKTMNHYKNKFKLSITHLKRDNEEKALKQRFAKGPKH